MSKFIKLVCEKCGNKNLKSRSKLGKYDIYIYQCGHVNSVKTVNINDGLFLGPSYDGKTPYPFQIDGIKFALQSNVVCLIADEMGLGKTIQALLTLRSRAQDLLPCAVFCKSKLKHQWAREIVRWCGPEYICQIIDTSKEPMYPGFKFYIFSQDLLRLRKELPEEFKTIGIKTIVIDEVQHIKNHQSQRAIEVRKLCKDVPHKIALSGTPIKNKAPEYFSILNILRPDMFPVYERFCYNHCEQYYTSKGYPKYGGLRYPEDFFEMTKDFIIRREWKNVFPEFPKINRQFKYFDMAKQEHAAYDNILGDFTQYMDSSDGEPFIAKQGNIMAYLAKMRHLTGLAKIEPVVDHVMDFLLDTDRQIAVFVHHKDVHQLLLMQLATAMKEAGLKNNIVSLEAALGDPIVEERKSEFLSGAARVLVASTLAYGEGLNLQSCADWVIMERQWNPANEEQAERRFARLGQTAEHLNSVYPVAIGTIDEYLSEIVEFKRGIFAQTMSGEVIDWNQSELVQQLCEKLASLGRRKWSF